MAFFKFILVNLILCQLTTLGPVSAAGQRFSIDLGTGRRGGVASIALQPDLESRITFVDLNLRQAGIGVSELNRLRVAVQVLRHANSEDEAMYEAVVIELRVPVIGTTADPALEAHYVGKDYY